MVELVGGGSVISMAYAILLFVLMAPGARE